MADCDDDARLQRFAAELRDAPVPLGDDARARVLAALRTEPAPSAARGHSALEGRDSALGARRSALPGRRRSLGWLVERRPVALSPVAGAALAASLVGLGVLGARTLSDRGAAPGRPALASAAAECTRPSGECRAPSPAPVATQFVLVAPRASSVALVGDFSDWRAMPMRAAAAGGVWTVTVPLAPGRHTYSFVVDGTTWTADPSAPFAPEDGFGSRNSVVMVGEAST